MGIAVASSEVDCSPLCVRAYCVWSEGVQQRSTMLELVKARAVANYVENTRAGGVFVLCVGSLLWLRQCVEKQMWLQKL